MITLLISFFLDLAFLLAKLTIPFLPLLLVIGLGGGKGRKRF
jgi:hypothetical protein